MVSDKRGGPVGAARGPRPVVTRPGSVNRGFASMDPERQREPVAESGNAADDNGKLPEAPGRRAPASGAAVPPKGTRRGRGQPGSGEEGGSA